MEETDGISYITERFTRQSAVGQINIKYLVIIGLKFLTRTLPKKVFSFHAFAPAIFLVF